MREPVVLTGVIAMRKRGEAGNAVLEWYAEDNKKDADLSKPE